MLRGKEEGIVTNIINEKLVEIEIEDGFRIPTLRNELVVVAAEESNFFEKEEVPAKIPEHQPKGKAVDAGFCLAFHAINDKDLSVFMINDTKNIIPYNVYYQEKSGVRGKMAGHLDPSSYIKIDEWDRRNFEDWPQIIIQALVFSSANKEVLAPLEKKFKIKASAFSRKEQIAPLILKKAHIFEINAPVAVRDLEKLSARFSEGVTPQRISQEMVFEKPSPVVDLHIEKLAKAADSLSPTEILSVQLEAFEKALDSAIAGGMPEITFIHGVGAGVLRDTIHKRLGKAPHIKYYKDAMKEKFGYGATLVRIE